MNRIKLYLKSFFHWHKWEYTHTEKSIIWKFNGSPLRRHYYKCKCGATCNQSDIF